MDKTILGYSDDLLVGDTTSSSLLSWVNWIGLVGTGGVFVAFVMVTLLQQTRRQGGHRRRLRRDHHRWGTAGTMKLSPSAASLHHHQQGGGGGGGNGGGGGDKYDAFATDIKGFEASIRLVSHEVRQDEPADGEKACTPPVTGIYDCTVEEQTISDKKTNTILEGGNHVDAVLTLTFVPIPPPSTSSNVSLVSLSSTCTLADPGWNIRGSSRINSRVEGGQSSSSSSSSSVVRFAIIQEGFVAPTGKAYWVESGSSNDPLDRCLVRGTFNGEEFTQVEWLNVRGIRGRYVGCTRREYAEDP